MEDNPRLSNERPCLENWPRDASLDGGDCYSEEEDSYSDSDYLASESDSDLDSDFYSDMGGSVTSDEKQEIFEDAKYLQAVQKGSLPVEGSTQDDNSNILDDNIHAVFDQAIQALHVASGRCPLSFQRFLNLKNLWKPQKTSENHKNPMTWKLMLVFPETS